ncbi:MAG TPA: hypothetical protein ENK02_00305 [Planctomycetes bacterium]|nr:hypothetical protein [Planctomycetota bacterium]
MKAILCSFATLSFIGSLFGQTYLPKWKEFPDQRIVLRGGYAFDPIRNRAVFFGGGWRQYSQKYLPPISKKTREYDFKSNRFLLRETKNHPPPLVNPGMAWDPNLKGVLLFGGSINETLKLSNQTWFYDGLDWKQLKPKHVPPKRYAMTLATDLIRKRVVMWGGAEHFMTFGAPPPTLRDTWEWDGRDWIQKFPKISPTPRFGFDMVFLPGKNQVFLYSGYRNSFGAYSDPIPWFWDGKNWEKGTEPKQKLFVNRQTPFYKPRRYLATNQLDRKVYILAYEKGNRYHGGRTHLFRWENQDWKEVLHPRFPSDFGAEHFLSTSWGVVCFGGFLKSGYLRGDIYGLRFDGKALFQLKGHLYPKGPRSVVYDKKRDQALFIDSFDFSLPGKPYTATATTWALRGNAFVPLQRGDPKGPWIYGDPLTVFHEGLGEPFMVEARRKTYWGEPKRQTWLWNGKGWIAQFAGNPLMTLPLALAYDRDRGTPLILDAQGYLWDWRPKKGWNRIPKSKTPIAPNPYVMKMAYDPSRKRLVLNGLGNGELYEWDGKQWFTLKPSPAPSPRYSTLTYVKELGGILMVGGEARNHTIALRDAWVWNGKSWKQLNFLVDNEMMELDFWKICFDSKRRRLLGALNTRYDPLTSVHSALLELPFPNLELDPPLVRTGGRITLDGRLKGQAGNLFVLLFSDGLWPGIELSPIAAGGKSLIFPLKPSSFFDVSLRAGLQSIVDRQDNVKWTIPIPNVPALFGKQIYWAGLTVNRQGKVGMVTNPVRMEIVR